MKQKRQKGSTVVEYLLVAAALFVAWSLVGDVKKGLGNHQAEYTWAIAQPNI